MQPASPANCKPARPFAETRSPVRAIRPSPDDESDPLSDDEEDEIFDPRFAELWDPGEFEDEEAEPEHGDFWPELDDDDE